MASDYQYSRQDYCHHLNSDDVDCSTLHEQPRLQFNILVNLDPADSKEAAVDSGPVRGRVPVDERERFDTLLGDARYGLRQRDDNVGLRLNWPIGLARRALLEIGHRLVSAGSLTAAEHAICLEPGEAAALLRGKAEPSAADVAERADQRKFQLTLDPPSSLGPEEEPPPFNVLPKPMGRATAAVMALIDAMQGAHGETLLTGVGVGGGDYTGRACVMAGPDDDFDRIEPGDVLIAPFTSPSFNSVVPLVGAIAVQEGGVMSHTAIVAREFGIPAVVGVNGLLGEIRDGEADRVDAAAGSVTPVGR